MITTRFARHVPLLLAALAAGGGAVSAAPSADVQAVSAAGSDFGFRLLHTLAAGKPNGNVFFSPFSISQALTLTLSGAGGQTRQGMTKTLGLEALTQAKVNTANAEILPALTSAPGVQITVANALWAGKNVRFSPAFQADAKRFYHAQAATLDLSAPSAAGTINAWVSRNTRGRIKTIVTPDDLLEAHSVLTNAVYFHGKWQKPFDKTETRPQPFHLGGGGTQTVPMMAQTDEFSYLDTPQFQAVSLPYGSGRVSLSVFLPKPGVSANTLAQNMTNRSADHWLAALAPTEIHLFLPRFKADEKAGLRGPLSTLGMGIAFSNAADFLPMGLGRTKIGAVFHEALLDIDEQGTTASAATAVIAMPTSAAPLPHPHPIPVMRVDRPFLVLIRDTKTGSLLFVGVIRDPQE
jgi:serine protease inhibitor